MACSEWNDEWVARLYDEMEPEQRGHLDAHLEHCSDCRETLAQLGHSRELLQQAAPDVPATPRVVVLQQRRVPWGGWAFAAGAACAAALFGLGFLARPSLTPGPPVAATRSAEGSTDSTDLPQALSPEDLALLSRQVRQFDARLAQLEGAPETAGRQATTDELLTRVQLRGELDHMQQQFDRERAKDLEFLLRAMTAAELRTGDQLDRTREALSYLAIRQDPRVSER